MFRQVSISQQQLETSTRASIGVRQIVVTKFSYNPIQKIPKFTFEVTVDNVGKTPAEVFVWARFDDKDWDKRDPHGDAVCKETEKHKTETYTVMPGFPWGYQITPDGAKIGSSNIPQKPILIGCISYNFPPDEVRSHQTAFIAVVSMKTTGAEAIPIRFDGGDIAPTDFKVFEPFNVRAN